MQTISPIVYAGLHKNVQSAVRLGVKVSSKSQIVSAICTTLKIEYEDLLGRSKVGELADARTITFYLLRKVAGMSYKSIGEAFRRDHSTIIYNVKKYSDLNSTDKQFQRKAYKVRTFLQGIPNE